MEKVKFGIVWRATDYCDSEVANFIDCADNIDNEDGVRDRYEAFLLDVYAGRVKPSTLVEPELLTLFIGDLDNRAHIDYLEGHYDDEPDIVAGGKRFWERCKKLRAIHPNLYRGM